MLPVILLAFTGTAIGAHASDLREATGPQVAAALSNPHPGRTKLVHVWASWCTPCAAELPRLLPALRKRSADVDMVLVSLDDRETAQAAARLLRKFGGAPGENLRAATAEAAWAIRALDRSWDGSLPATYIISSEGRLLLAQRGITDLDALLFELDKTPRANGSTSDRRKQR